MLLKDSREGARMCENNCSVAFASERTRHAIRDKTDSAIVLLIFK